MWVAEEVPVSNIFPGRGKSEGAVRVILEHRSREAAGKAMGHYLRAVSRRPKAKINNECAMFEGVAEAFGALGKSRTPVDFMVIIGNRAYRVREKIDA